MNCSTNKIKQWVVYDAKEKTFLEFTNEEFKNLLLDRPVKLLDTEIFSREKSKKVWIDGVLNNEFFIKT